MVKRAVGIKEQGPGLCDLISVASLGDISGQPGHNADIVQLVQAILKEALLTVTYRGASWAGRALPRGFPLTVMRVMMNRSPYMLL